MLKRDPSCRFLETFTGQTAHPHEWHCEFDKEAIAAGGVCSKFDNCLYYCYVAVATSKEFWRHMLMRPPWAGQEKYIRKPSFIEKLRDGFPFRKWR